MRVLLISAAECHGHAPQSELSRGDIHWEPFKVRLQAHVQAARKYVPIRVARFRREREEIEC